MDSISVYHVTHIHLYNLIKGNCVCLVVVSAMTVPIIATILCSNIQ